MSSTAPVDPTEESRKLQPLQGLGALNFPIQNPAAPPAPGSSIAEAPASDKSAAPASNDPTLEAPNVNMGSYSTFVNQARAQGFNLEQVGAAANAQEFIANIQAQMGQITNSVLSKWVQSIQDIGQQQAKTRAAEDVEKTKTEAVQAGQEASKLNASKAVAGGAALLGGFMLGGMLMPGVAQVASLSIVPMTQAVQAIAIGGIVALPAAFTSLVVLFGAGALLQANILTAMSGKSTGKTAVNAEFVENYSQRILSTINDPEFNDTLFKLNTNGDAAATHLQIAQAKLILLATALALSYKAETGGLTGEEFETMIQGNMPFKKGDPRYDLIKAFQGILYNDLSPAQGTALLTNLKGYFNTNPNLKDLLEPSNALPAANVLPASGFGPPRRLTRLLSF